MNNLTISSLHVLLNQIQENINADSHLIILVRLGNQVKRTHVWSEDKFSGEWTDKFIFNRTNEDCLEIRLSALATPQSVSGQLLGVARIPFSQIEDKKNIQEWFDLINNGEIAGKVHSKIIFQVDSQLNNNINTNIYSVQQIQSNTNKDLPSNSIHTADEKGSLTYNQSNLEFTSFENKLQQKRESKPSLFSDFQTTSQNQLEQSSIVPYFKQQLNFLKAFSSINSMREDQNPSQLINKSNKSISQYSPSKNEQLPSFQQYSAQSQNQNQYLNQQSQYQPLLKLQNYQQQSEQQYNRYQSLQNNTPKYDMQQSQQTQTKQNLIGDYKQIQQVSSFSNEIIKDPLYSSQNMATIVPQSQQFYYNNQSNTINNQNPSQIQKQDNLRSSQLILQPLLSKPNEVMSNLTNTFDKQFSINKHTSAQQQNNIIQQQPLIQSVAKLIPNNQYQEQQKQLNIYDPQCFNQQNTYQSKNQLNNSQIKLVSLQMVQQSKSEEHSNISQPILQDQYQQQQTKLNNSQIKLIPLQQINQQNTYNSLYSNQVNLLNQNNVHPFSSAGQTLSNSQIKLIPFQQQNQNKNVFQQRPTNTIVQTSPQINSYYQPFQQYQQQTYTQQPKIQYVYS